MLLSGSTAGCLRLGARPCGLDVAHECPAERGTGCCAGIALTAEKVMTCAASVSCLLCPAIAVASLHARPRLVSAEVPQPEDGTAHLVVASLPLMSVAVWALPLPESGHGGLQLTLMHVEGE